MNKELAAAAISIIFLASIFGLALHLKTPREAEITIRIFDSYIRNGRTTIYPYDHEVMTFKGEYNFTSGATYHIKYLDTPPYYEIISLEEVHG